MAFRSRDGSAYAMDECPNVALYSAVVRPVPAGVGSSAL